MQHSNLNKNSKQLSLIYRHRLLTFVIERCMPTVKMNLDIHKLSPRKTSFLFSQHTYIERSLAVRDSRHSNRSKGFTRHTAERNVSKGSNPFTAREDMHVFADRKSMLRSASARICVTDTQACARYILKEITAKTLRYARANIFRIPIRAIYAGIYIYSIYLYKLEVFNLRNYKSTIILFSPESKFCKQRKKKDISKSFVFLFSVFFVVILLCLLRHSLKKLKLISTQKSIVCISV